MPNYPRSAVFHLSIEVLSSITSWCGGVYLEKQRTRGRRRIISRSLPFLWVVALSFLSSLLTATANYIFIYLHGFLQSYHGLGEERRSFWTSGQGMGRKTPASNKASQRTSVVKSAVAAVTPVGCQRLHRLMDTGMRGSIEEWPTSRFHRKMTSQVPSRYVLGERHLEVARRQ